MAFAPLLFFMSNGADMGALTTFKKIYWQGGPMSLLSHSMKRVWCLIACALLPITGMGQVTITIDIGADILKDFSGSAMGLDGLVVLAASTSPNGFAAPTPTKFFPDPDDFELAHWNLHNPGLEQPGVLFRSGPITVNGDFTPGTSAIQLYWFPSLTSPAGALVGGPGAGTHYGLFTDNIGGKNGGESWFMPGKTGGPEANRTLRFITTDGVTLDPGAGSFAPSFGNASLTVIPEPSVYAWALGLCCLAWAIIARRIRSSPKV
jgi:hypothetical protein